MSDYIKREDAIKELQEEWEEAMVEGINASEILSDSEDAIYRVPSADVVERKRGHWINVRQEGACSWTGECSCCHDRNDIPPPILAHFCPNCGADMGERKDNDNKGTDTSAYSSADNL